MHTLRFGNFGKIDTFLQPERYALISPAKSDFPFPPRSKNTVQLAKMHTIFQNAKYAS